MFSLQSKRLFAVISWDLGILFWQREFVLSVEGARWSSGIDAAIGAPGRGLRPVYLTVQRPWTSR